MSCALYLFVYFDSDSRNGSIIYKGPIYRFSSPIDYNKCVGGNAGTLQEFYKR